MVAANPTTARRLSGASPENLPTGRRPTAEPAQTQRKTEENAKMAAPEAEPALLPREKALRTPPGKPVVRENRRHYLSACQSWLKWARRC